MLDIGIVGPIVIALSATDIVLHLYLDVKKFRRQTLLKNVNLMCTLRFMRSA